MRQAVAVTNRPPGWYPDSSVPGHERWWDGGTWSHVTRPKPGAPARQQPEQRFPPRPDAGRSGSSSYGHPGYPGYPAGPGGGVPGIGRRTTTDDGVPLADPARRLLARFIDVVVVGAVTLVVGSGYLGRLFDAVSVYVDKAQRATASGGTQPGFFDLYNQPGYVSNLVALVAIQLVIRALYHIPMIALRGATLGKMLAGVRVRPWDHEGLPTWGQSALRWMTSDLIGSVLSQVYGLIDALWLLWDGRRQCLHDKLPRTVVVAGRPHLDPGVQRPS
jgi:uncharacterized RDD family membrane protein YckC